MPIDVNSLTREVERLKRRQETLRAEIKEIPKQLKALNTMIAVYDSRIAPVPSTNGNRTREPKTKRRKWPNYPAKCLLPASFHDGISNEHKSLGLCNKHVTDFRRGTLPHEELEEYTDRATAWGERHGFEVQL